MANASKNHMGAGSHGKGSGTGAMTELPEGVIEEDMVLRNRDKSLDSDDRGLDSRSVQTEQYHDHSANRRNFGADQGGASANVSGLTSPMSDTSAEDSSLDDDA